MSKKTIVLNLVGLDGNAFSIMGAFSKQARKEGWTKEEIDAVLTEAKAGDYSHLLATIMDHCTDTPDDLEGMDEEEQEEPIKVKKDKKLPKVEKTELPEVTPEASLDKTLDVAEETAVKEARQTKAPVKKQSKKETPTVKTPACVENWVSIEVAAKAVNQTVAQLFCQGNAHKRFGIAKEIIEGKKVYSVNLEAVIAWCSTRNSK